MDFNSEWQMKQKRIMMDQADYRVVILEADNVRLQQELRRAKEDLQEVVREMVYTERQLAAYENTLSQIQDEHGEKYDYRWES